ncbi:MAG: hypothetical protein OQJ81_04130 [Melioribacteraceae bacterium]|nr:hypothetical protein [Melioribacteraceae bacterium]
MINQNIHTQQFESIEMINEFPISETRKHLDAYVNKISSIDIKQIKSYLGIVYFGIVTVLSITLLF